MKMELTWFQQSFESGTVSYNVRHTPDSGKVFGFDYSVSPEVVQARAEAAGKTTWDEEDIREHHLAEHGEAITLAEPPKPPTQELLTPVDDGPAPVVTLGAPAE